ncbi:hypothetical protein AB0N05_09005 [Nocardia sp. NPDC051030]|uniref:hypothetical protein n=1 Tax=Nocardia sp. NPDC051030 TaxID=3155162 RepID=UPI003414136B
MSKLIEQTDDAAADSDETAKPPEPQSNSRRRDPQVSVKLSTVAYGLAVVLALLLTAGPGIGWYRAHSELSDRDAAAAADKQAENVATEYAVGASTIDFKNIDTWTGKLAANTTPQLTNKFTATAPTLREIVNKLQWVSTATPITAKVMSETSGVYKVNVFLNVSSSSVQSQAGGQTTVTYTITIDKNSDWKITDVGGMDGALPGR